jgi:hypothetical protein
MHQYPSIGLIKLSIKYIMYSMNTLNVISISQNNVIKLSTIKAKEVWYKAKMSYKI